MRSAMRLGATHRKGYCASTDRAMDSAYRGHGQGDYTEALGTPPCTGFTASSRNAWTQLRLSKEGEVAAAIAWVQERATCPN